MYDAVTLSQIILRCEIYQFRPRNNRVSDTSSRFQELHVTLRRGKRSRGLKIARDNYEKSPLLENASSNAFIMDCHCAVIVAKCKCSDDQWRTFTYGTQRASAALPRTIAVSNKLLRRMLRRVTHTFPTSG